MGTYLAFTDALESFKDTFPGCETSEKLKAWGWKIRAEVWEFRIEVEALNQNVVIRFQEAVMLPRKGRTFLTRETYNDIQSLGELKVALLDIRATLMGISQAVFQFCSGDS